MTKRNKIFGLLLVFLFSISAVVVYAAEALTEEKFKEKMEDMGYEVSDGWSGVTATKGEGEDAESYEFAEFDSEAEAKESLATAYAWIKAAEAMAEDTEDVSIKCNSCEVDAKGDTGYLLVTGKEDGKTYASLTARVGKTVITATGPKSEVLATMKKLGYYSGTNWVLYVVIGVVGVGAIGAVVYFLTKKKNNNMNNGGMNYGQPMMNSMNQGMNNYGQPMMNNMNQGINNFGQPVNNNPQPMMGQPAGFGQPQPMDQGMNNFGQSVNNNPQPMMGQPAGFGQPQPVNDMNQGMNNFGQPVNNNPMNNNFPNMN